MLLPAAQPDSMAWAHEVALRHRAFMQELTDSTGDPGRFMQPLRFALFDADSPRAAGPASRGTGHDYFRVLATVLDSVRLEIVDLEVYVSSPRSALVIAYHAEASPTVTTWVDDAGEWRAAALTLNATDAMLQSIRMHHGANGPRSPG